MFQLPEVASDPVKDAPTQPSRSIHRVLVVIAPNHPGGDAALQEAITIARTRGATLRLVCIADPWSLGPEVVWASPERLERELATEARAALDAALQKASLAGVAPELVVVVAGGSSERALAAEAQRWQADLVVCPADPPPSLPAAADSPVWARVARLAHAPVLLV